MHLVSELFENKVRNLLRKSAELAWNDLWWSMLGVAVQYAVAASLLAVSGHKLMIDDACPTAPELDRYGLKYMCHSF